MVLSAAVTCTLIVFGPTASDTCWPFIASASASRISVSLPSRYTTLAPMSVRVGAMVICSTLFGTDAV